MSKQLSCYRQTDKKRNEKEILKKICLSFYTRKHLNKLRKSKQYILSAKDKALAHVTGDMRLGKIVLCHSAEIFQPGHPIPESHEGDSKKKTECASEVRNEVLPAV